MTARVSKAGIERRSGGRRDLMKAANDVMVLGFRVHLVATSDGADFDAAIVGGVGRDELVESGLNGELVFTESGGRAGREWRARRRRK